MENMTKKRYFDSDLFDQKYLEYVACPCGESKEKSATDLRKMGWHRFFSRIYKDYVACPSNELKQKLATELWKEGYHHFLRQCLRSNVPEDIADGMVKDAFCKLCKQSPGDVKVASGAMFYTVKGLISDYWKNEKIRRQYKEGIENGTLRPDRSDGPDQSALSKLIDEAIEKAKEVIVTQTVGIQLEKRMKRDVLRAMFQEYIDIILERHPRFATRKEWLAKGLPCFLTPDNRTLTPDEFKTSWNNRLGKRLREKIQEVFHDDIDFCMFTLEQER